MTELKVIDDYYAFMVWLIQHTEKFPKHHRYSLGIAMENRLQAILGLLLKAKYRSDKGARLWAELIAYELGVRSPIVQEFESYEFSHVVAASSSSRGRSPYLGKATVTIVQE